MSRCFGCRGSPNAVAPEPEKDAATQLTESEMLLRKELQQVNDALADNKKLGAMLAYNPKVRATQAKSYNHLEMRANALSNTLDTVDTVRRAAAQARSAAPSSSSNRKETGTGGASNLYKYKGKSYTLRTGSRGGNYILISNSTGHKVKKYVMLA